MSEEKIHSQIHHFLNSYLATDDYRLVPITNSASNRKYFRVISNSLSYILTYSENRKENETFIYFSKIFKEYQISVPEILLVNETNTIYLQEDIGDLSLFLLLQEQGESNLVKDLYKKSLTQLVIMQMQTSKKLDYSQCYDFQNFDKSLILNDLNYFKFYFFQPLEIPFSNSKLSEEFSEISEKVSALQPTGFMFRDFQARNIMVKNNEPYFIDYQGGMKGIIIYDLISLIWQAKANLSESFKNELKEYYFSLISKNINQSIQELEETYQYCLLIRLLQVLGAYGFRGILQKKMHFIESIFFGIKNLEYLMSHSSILENYPELQRILFNLQQEETHKRIKKLIDHE